jgi:hypothetical protein
VFDMVSLVGSQWAALIALLLSAYFLITDRRAGVTADAQVLDFGSIVYFVLLTAAAFTAPHAAVLNYESGLSSAWLALIAGVSLLIRQPFTLGIAKRRTTPEVWNTPTFRHTSTVLARAWAISFAASAIGTITCEATDASATLSAVVQVLGFAIPATFTHFYVQAVRARVANLQAQPAVGN